MQKWEYRVIWLPVNTGDNGVTIAILNELGSEGWELGSATADQRVTDQLACIFKRPLSQAFHAAS